MLPTMFWNKLNKAGEPMVKLRRWLLAVVLMITVAFGAGAGVIADPLPQETIATVFEQGLTALKRGDYGAAAVYLDQVLDQGDHRPAVYRYRCAVAVQLEDAAGAIAPCTAALRSSSPSPQPYLYRGLAHYRLGHHEAAYGDLTTYLNARPADGIARYNRGLVAFAQGRYAAAIADYHAALSQPDPLDPLVLAQVFNDLGLAHWAQAQPAVAQAYLDQAIALDEDNLRAYFNRGCVCHHQRQYAAALEDFEQVLTLDPTHAETYLNRGKVRRQLGDTAGALSDWQWAAHYFEAQGQAAGYYQARQLLWQSQSAAVALG
jgi:tetratricopeptide (TPR) repeat protein